MIRIFPHESSYRTFHLLRENLGVSYHRFQIQKNRRCYTVVLRPLSVL